MCYTVKYYDGYKKDSIVFTEVQCYIDRQTRAGLFSAKLPDFVALLINDGDELIIRTDNIISLMQEKEVS